MLQRMKRKSSTARKASTTSFLRDAAGVAIGEAGVSPSARGAVVGEVDALNDFFAKLDDESHAGISRMREARSVAGLGGLMGKL